MPRRAQRYQSHLEVQELNGQVAAGVLVVDISSLGARLESSQPLAPRNLVEFTVRLPDVDADLKLSGKVVWMRPLLEAPGRYQIGVQFLGTVWELDRLGREGKFGKPLM